MAVSTIDPNGLNVGQLGGDRNILINGAMTVAQRGTSFTGITGSSFGVDRFQTNGNNGTWTVSQDTDAPDGFSNSLKLLLTATETLISTSYMAIQQKIEGLNLQQLAYGTSAAKTVTLSFWVKSNITGTYCLNLYQDDGTKNYPQTYTINSADTWEYKSISYAGDTATSLDNDNATSLRTMFFLVAGSDFSSGSAGSRVSYTNATFAAGQSAQVGGTINDYFQITGVQFEVGDTATDFEHESYGTTLQKCKRYYEIVWYGTPASNAGTTASYGAYFQTGVPMRAAPSASQTASTSFYDFPGANVNSANNQFTAGLNSVSGGSTYYRAQQASSSTRTYFEGFITLDAEL
jgi:hypothetical protein